jgi:hypothetical protein
MKPIKSVTFQAIENLANEISLHHECENFNSIRLKISDYLITDGNKNFVETYNELAATKNFEKAIQKLKI